MGHRPVTFGRAAAMAGVALGEFVCTATALAQQPVPAERREALMLTVWLWALLALVAIFFLMLGAAWLIRRARRPLIDLSAPRQRVVYHDLSTGAASTETPERQPPDPPEEQSHD